MNFKLEKKTTNGTTRYIFKVDDKYADTEFFDTDEDATKWYQKFKEVYEPDAISVIDEYKSLKLERRIKIIVMKNFEVKTQYIYALWKGVVLENIDVKYTQEEHDQKYEDNMALFLKYKFEYNIPKPVLSDTEILFDENN